MLYKLISFVICPYVQRAAITLKFKEIPFEIEYIDLKNKPEWFLKISPAGKVPILIINNEDVIFESPVINELIDELNLPATLSIKPIIKAKERAWIIFADSLFSDLFNGLRSNGHEKYFEDLMDKFEKLENVISDKGFFKEEGFSIIDSAYAPIFFRMQYIEQLAYHPKLMKLKKVSKWYGNLLAQKYVKHSVRDDFEKQFKDYISQANSNIRLIGNAHNI